MQTASSTHSKAVSEPARLQHGVICTFGSPKQRPSLRQEPPSTAIWAREWGHWRHFGSLPI